MQLNYKNILPFCIFLFFFSSSLAQDYEIIGEFEKKIGFRTSPSIIYSDKSKQLVVNQYITNARGFISPETFIVDFTKGGKVIDRNTEDESNNQKYTNIGTFFSEKKDSSIYIFRKDNKPSLFYFSYKEELEDNESWTVDISSLSDIKLNDKITYEVETLTESIVAILAFDMDESSTSHLVVVDTKKRKLLNFFPIKIQSNRNSLSETFNNLYSDGKYIVYQEYEHERFPRKDTKHLNMQYNDEIGKHIQTFYVQKLGANEKQQYQIDQSKYYVGKTQAYLLDNGTLQCVGLYSETPQARFNTQHMFQTESAFTNNVRGIFVQSFKNGQKISDEQIPLTSEIIKKAVTELDGSIALASLAPAPLKKEENKTTLMTIEVDLYPANEQRQKRFEKITLCIDENNKITWWDLLHIGRGEHNNILIQLKTEEEVQMDEKYTTLVVNSEQITAYKAICGSSSSKTFKIPNTIEGYKYTVMQSFMSQDNDVYALYTNGQKNLLIRFKTGEAFKAILD